MANKGTCKADSCEKDVRAKGYCDTHYRKWRKGGMPKPRYNTCHTDKCRKPLLRRGLCEEHYSQKFSKQPESTETVAEAPAEEAAS